MPVTPPPAAACTPADVEAWLARLGLAALGRSDREGISAWDVVLSGYRRPELRVTVILDPALAVICWAHYAPPIGDAFRVSYRKLLRWNDELPFVKFALAEDERPIVAAEIPIEAVDADVLGLALARLLAVADHLLPESSHWLEAGGWPVRGSRHGPAGRALLARYASALGELGAPGTRGPRDGPGDGGPADGSAGDDGEPGGVGGAGDLAGPGQRPGRPTGGPPAGRGPATRGADEAPGQATAAPARGSAG